MDEVLSVVPHDPSWSGLFRSLGADLRGALGERAIRIDHIGSTAVPDLAAKPIIDVQISVVELEPTAPFREPLEALGFVWRHDNPELTKRYFREAPGTRRTHIHVRRTGSFDEQFALLFRDYLRVHPAAAGEYAAVKGRLSPLLRSDRHAYSAAKGPFIWDTMRAADEWAQSTGWEPGASDA